MNHLAALLLRALAFATFANQRTLRGRGFHIGAAICDLLAGAGEYAGVAPDSVRVVQPDPAVSMINAPGGEA